MRCPNCGLDVDDRYGFCTMCGSRFQVDCEDHDAGSDDDDDYDYLEYEVIDDPGCDPGQDAYGVPCAAKSVSPALVALISVISGIGHIYLGRMRLGIGILVFQIVIASVGTMLLDNLGSNVDAFAVISLIIVAIAMAAFAICDSYASAKVYNEYVEHYGRKPW